MRSFQLAYDKFKAANAQVLGVSVDYSNANRAFSGAHNLSFPLLSDAARQVAIAYGVLYDDPKMVDDPKKVPLFRRAQRSWFVIEKEGVIRYATTTHWSVFDKNDEVLAVLDKL